VTTDGTLTTSTHFGDQPNAGLVEGPDGAFYGTTMKGGANYLYGSVFRVTTNLVLTTLVSFGGTNQGSFPQAGLALGTDAALYGTTPSTIFRVTTNGALTTILSITGTNGVYRGAPYFSRLTQGSDGAFYGTTAYGGVNATGAGSGYGTVFRATTDGILTTLALFGGTNGSNPNADAALVRGNDGAFYGTVKRTVFRVTTNGLLTTLASFTSLPGGLIPTTDGTFYLTVGGGGSRGGGSVFRLNLASQVMPPIASGNTWLIPFIGLPGDAYRLLRATTLAGPWTGLATVTAGSDGTGQFADTNPPPAAAFYRTVYP
jgi:hypothetical protein